LEARLCNLDDILREIERVKAEYRRRRGSLCGFCGQQVW
jgi:hypothetical protein